MGSIHKYFKFIFVLLQWYISMTYGFNTDCGGKAFHCVNSTHFNICVDLGGGVSKTVDDFLLPCPENTYCMSTNYYECEYHETTTTTTTVTSDISAVNEFGKESIIPLFPATNYIETTTAAETTTIEYQISSTEKLLEKSSTVSTLEIRNTSNIRSDNESITGITNSKLHPSATKNVSLFADKSDNFNRNLTKENSKYFGNITKDVSVITNNTKYYNVSDKSLNTTSDKILSFEAIGEILKDIENGNSTLLEQNGIRSESKATINLENINSDGFAEVFKTDNTSIKNIVLIKSNIKDMTLNDTKIDSEKGFNKVNDSSSLDPFISKSILTENKTNIINYFSNQLNDIQLEKATINLNENLNTNNNSVVNITFNKNSESEALESTTITINSATEKNTDTVSSTPNYSDVNNLQAINENHVLRNLVNGSTLMSNVQNQSLVNNNKIIQKISSETTTESIIVEKNNGIRTSNSSTFIEGNYSYSPFKLVSTENPEIISTGKDFVDLRTDNKRETEYAYQSPDVNSTSIIHNIEKKNHSATTETTLISPNTNKSRNINNIEIFSVDYVKNVSTSFDGNMSNNEHHIPLYNKTNLLQSDSSNLNENFINTSNNIIELPTIQTTTEESILTTTNTNIFNMNNFRDDLQKIVTQIETAKNNLKTEDSETNIEPQGDSQYIMIESPKNSVIEKEQVNINDNGNFNTNTPISMYYASSQIMTTDYETTITNIVNVAAYEHIVLNQAKGLDISTPIDEKYVTETDIILEDYNVKNNSESKINNITTSSPFYASVVTASDDSRHRINKTEPFSNLLKTSLSNVLLNRKNYDNNANNNKTFNNNTTSIANNLSLLMTTGRYDASASNHLSAPSDGVVIKINPNKLSELNNSNLPTEENYGYNTTNTSTSTGSTNNSKSNNKNLNFGRISEPSLIFTTTVEEEISTGTENSLLNRDFTNIILKQPDSTISVKDTFTKNLSILNDIKYTTNTSKHKDVQEHFSTDTESSVLKNISFGLHETTTQMGQISTGVYETTTQKEQDFIDKQEAYLFTLNKTLVSNQSSIGVLLYPINKYSEVRDKAIDSNDENQNKTILSSTLQQRLHQNETHNNTAHIEYLPTKEYKTSTPVSKRIPMSTVTEKIYKSDSITHVAVNRSELPKSFHDSSKRNVPVHLEILMRSTEFQLKHKENTTESFQSSLPVSLIEINRTNTSDNKTVESIQITVTKKNDISEQNIALKTVKNNETMNGEIPKQNTYAILSIVPVALGRLNIKSTENTTSALFNHNSNTEEPVTSQIDVPKLYSEEPKLNNFNYFYASTNFSNVSNVELKTDAQNSTKFEPYLSNYFTAATPIYPQTTKQTLRSKAGNAFIDTRHNVTDIFNTVTTPYKINLRSTEKASDLTLVGTTRENQVTRISLSVQSSTTPTTKALNAENIVRKYLLTHASVRAPISTNKSQSSLKYNASESGSSNLSDTFVVQRKDALNLTVIKIDSKSNSTNPIKDFTANKPENYLLNVRTKTNNSGVIQEKDPKFLIYHIPLGIKLLNQKDLKANASRSQFVSNTIQNKTNDYIATTASSKEIKNINPPNVVVISKELRVDTVNKKLKTTNTIKISGDNSNIKNTHGTVLGEKSSDISNHSKVYTQRGNVTNRLLRKRNNITAEQNKCLNQPKGRYADKNDCKKFYLCLGDAKPTFGQCPNGTVFSESKKQCTKNLSQCYRNNQFTCLSSGRYYDLSLKNVYYICVTIREKFIKFKYQCQNGYSLNESVVKCIRDSNSSAQKSDSSNTREESTSVSVETSLKTNETLKKEGNKKDDEFECKKEGKFPHPDKCNKFYLCSRIKKSYVRKIKTCDSGEAFDKEKQKCVDTDSQECK